MNELRAEYAALGTRLWQFALTRMLVASILLLGISEGLGQIEGERFVRLVADARELSQPKAFNLRQALRSNDAMIPYNYSGPLKETVTALREEHARILTLELSILGATVRFSMLGWAFWAPIMLVLSEIYPSVLRAKRRILHALAVADAGDRVAFDRLVFGRQPHEATPYAKQPYALLQRAEYVLYAVCIGYLLHQIVQGGAVLIEEPKYLLGAVVTAAWYAMAISLGVELRMRDDAGVPPRPSPVIAELRLGGAWLLRRLQGQQRMAQYGASLVLLSLILGTGVQDCAHPVSGLHLLADREPKAGEWRGFFSAKRHKDPGGPEERLTEPPGAALPSQAESGAGAAAGDDAVGPAAALHADNRSGRVGGDAGVDSRMLTAPSAAGQGANVTSADAVDTHRPFPMEAALEEKCDSVPTAHILWPSALWVLAARSPDHLCLPVMIHWVCWCAYVTSLTLSLILFVAPWITRWSPRVSNLSRWCARVALYVATLLIVDSGVALAGLGALPSWTPGYAQVAVLTLAISLVNRVAPWRHSRQVFPEHIEPIALNLLPIVGWSAASVLTMAIASDLWGYLALHVGVVLIAACTLTGAPRNDLPSAR